MKSPDATGPAASSKATKQGALDEKAHKTPGAAVVHEPSMSSAILSVVTVLWSMSTMTTTTAVPTSVSWAAAIDAADSVPASLAASASAGALRDAAGRMAPLDAIRAELQPGTQFHPFDALTSPAGQMVVEATAGSAVLFGTRQEHARSAADVLQADASVVRQQRRLQLSDAWCDRRAAELAEAAAHEALDDARTLLNRLERLQPLPAAGLVVSIDDIVAVRALATEKALAVLDAEAARLESGLRLGRLVGVASELATSGPLPHPGELPADDEPDPREGPEVARAHAAVVAARAALVAFERELGPTLGVGIQAQLDDGDTGFAYGRVSVSVPRLDGDPRARAELLARIHLAEAELIELRRARSERLSLARHEVEHQAHTVSLVDNGLVPAALERRRIAEKRHALGAADIFEVVTAARAEHEARRRGLLARVELARAHMTLSLLDPGPLDDAGPQGHEGHAGHHDADGVSDLLGPQESRP